MNHKVYNDNTVNGKWGIKMLIPTETMMFKGMQHAIELGNVKKANIFRDPSSRAYVLSVTFERWEPKFHQKAYSLLSQRGEIRTFKTADAAFKVANDLGLYAVELVCDPCQEERYDSGSV